MKSGISANPCRVWRPNVAKILDKVLNNLFTTTNFQKKENNMEGEVSIKQIERSLWQVCDNTIQGK